MKSNKFNNLKRNPGIFLLIFFAIGLLINFSGCGYEYTIDNPYEKVNWQEYGRYKADLHSHTSVSDGYFSPHVLVDRYHELGYDIVAITDHNVVTYPWQEFSSLEASSRTYQRLDAGQLNDLPHEDIFVYENRDPDSFGMIAIKANEVSQNHHMGSYFSNFGHYKEFVGNYFDFDADFTTTTVEESLEGIANKNGLAVLFHPGRYQSERHKHLRVEEFQENKPVEWYVNLFQRFDNLIGMEAYNSGWNYNPGNIYKWDSTLIQLMPERPLWGFSNSDFHGSGLGRNWNVFLLDKLSITEVRNAMKNGLFYFVYAPEGHDGSSPPEINSIEVNSRRGTIHIDASDYQFIEWISDGVVVYVGDSVNLSDLPEVGSYIRANIYQSKYGSSVTHTQPFGIRRL